MPMGLLQKGTRSFNGAKIDHRIIDVAAERNPDKYGALTLGTDIPIVSEADSRNMNPDYYLVLPWHFKEEFIEREHAMLDKGIGFIFHYPRFKL